jgi:hypothetical protein
MSGPRRIHSQQRADKDLFEARKMLQYCGSFEAELELQIDVVERGRQQMEQQMDPSANLAALLLAGHYVATRFLAREHSADGRTDVDGAACSRTCSIASLPQRERWRSCD